jgi:hypothetical protein
MRYDVLHWLYNTLVKGKRTQEKTMIYKTLHITIKIEQHEPYKKYPERASKSCSTCSTRRVHGMYFIFSIKYSLKHNENSFYTNTHYECKMIWIFISLLQFLNILTEYNNNIISELKFEKLTS